MYSDSNALYSRLSVLRKDHPCLCQQNHIEQLLDNNNLHIHLNNFS